MMITFRVGGTPIPQPRPRSRVMYQGGQARAVVYHPAKHPVEQWKLRVLDAWRLVMPSPGYRFDGPLAVHIEAVTPRPAAKVWKTKPMPREWDTRRSSGDADNIAKAVLDALNGKAWHDDAQVCRLIVEQIMASGDEEPHAVVSISRLSEPISPPRHLTATTRHA